MRLYEYFANDIALPKHCHGPTRTRVSVTANIVVQGCTKKSVKLYLNTFKRSLSLNFLVTHCKVYFSSCSYSLYRLLL